jgi:hypothetical protein
MGSSGGSEMGRHSSPRGTGQGTGVRRLGSTSAAAGFTRPPAFSWPRSQTAGPSAATPRWTGPAARPRRGPAGHRPWWLLAVCTGLTALVVVVGVGITRPVIGMSTSSTPTAAGSTEPNPTTDDRAAFASALESHAPVALTTAQVQQAVEDGITLCGLARSDHRPDLADALNRTPASGTIGDYYDTTISRISHNVMAPAGRAIFSATGQARLESLLDNFERETSAYFCPDIPAGV